MSIQIDISDYRELGSVWAGLLELRTLADSEACEEGFAGAFVTVLVRCDSAQEYMALAAEILREEGYEIHSVEQLAPLSSGNFEITPELAELVEKTENYPIQWTTFQRFRSSH